MKRSFRNKLIGLSFYLITSCSHHQINSPVNDYQGDDSSRSVPTPTVEIPLIEKSSQRYIFVVSGLCRSLNFLSFLRKENLDISKNIVFAQDFAALTYFLYLVFENYNRVEWELYKIIDLYYNPKMIEKQKAMLNLPKLRRYLLGLPEIKNDKQSHKFLKVVLYNFNQRQLKINPHLRMVDNIIDSLKLGYQPNRKYMTAAVFGGYKQAMKKIDKKDTLIVDFIRAFNLSKLDSSWSSKQIKSISSKSLNYNSTIKKYILNSPSDPLRCEPNFTDEFI